MLAMIGCDGEDEATPTPTATVTATPAATIEPTATPSVSPTATASPATTPTVIPQETAPQLLHCRFRGSVQLDGADVPDGTVLTIIVEGDEYETTTPSVYGPSTYAQKIIPKAGKVYTNGTAVTFKIDGHLADQTGSWETGGNIKIDLTASSP
jgi:hypothetical protein